ncbi:MAG: nitroreductase, partial [Planctomycetota bacterium]
AAVGIPEGFEPVSMIAIGHRGEPDSLPDELREREQAPRSRRPMAEFVYGARWGEPAAWLERGD